MPTSKVSFRRFRDPSDLKSTLKRCVDDIDGVVWRKGETVILKPNVCLYRFPCRGGLVTNPMLVKALAELIIEGGAEPVIAESSIVGRDTSESFRMNGYEEVARSLGIKLVDLKGDEYVKLPVPNPYVQEYILAFKMVVDADRLVNMPVVKTHTQTLLSLALKNMKGCTPDIQKRRTHRMGLEYSIVDINKVLKADLIIEDGTLVYDRERDKTLQLNFIVASRDPVAADATVARLLGNDPEMITHIKLAYESKLGELYNIEVLGEEVKPLITLRYNFKGNLSTSFRNHKIDVTIHERNACSGCFSQAKQSIYNVIVDDDVDVSGIDIVMGDVEEAPASNKLLIFGVCAEKLRGAGVYVRGCPPKIEDGENAIRRLIHKKE